MTDSLSIIDPASYATMDIVAVPDEEAILAARMTTYVAKWIEHDPPMGAVYDVQNLEFDPHKIVQETCTVYQGIVLNRINQAARATTLAFAQGRDLDAIASRFPGGVPRVASEIYDYTTALYPERVEKDNRYRQRIWMVPFKLARGSTAFGYRFDAMTLTDARDVSVRVERSPDQVSSVITLMMNSWDDPVPSKAQVLDAYRLLNEPEIVQNTDVLAVRPVVRIDRHYRITVYFRPYVDKDAIVRQIDGAPLVAGEPATGLTKFLRDTAFYIGRDQGRQEIEGLCNVAGVHHVEIEGFDGEVMRSESHQVIRATHEIVPGDTIVKRGVL